MTDTKFTKQDKILQLVFVILTCIMAIFYITTPRQGVYSHLNNLFKEIKTAILK
jgi:hypothetical protein